MDAKFTELVEQLNGLDFKGMYGSDFLHTWDKTTDELKALYIVADALRELRENNVSPIDDKHAAAILGQRTGDIDGAGGLTYAALLPSHAHLPAVRLRSPHAVLCRHALPHQRVWRS